MKRLRTAKLEMFALGVARGLSLKDAATAAGYSKPGGSASTSAAKPQFVERVAALEKTLDWSGTRDVRPVIDKLAELAGNVSDTTSPASLKAVADIYGRIAELKQQLPPDIEFHPAGDAPAGERPMTKEEWIARFQPGA